MKLILKFAVTREGKHGEISLKLLRTSIDIREEFVGNYRGSRAICLRIRVDFTVDSLGI